MQIRKIQELPEVDQDYFASLILDEVASYGEGASDEEDEAYRLLVRVRDQGTFLDFVAALVSDRERAVALEKVSPTEHLGPCPDAGGWYNFEIESYLEAAQAWARSTGMKLPKEYSEEDLWRAFAEFLYLGKIYE